MDKKTYNLNASRRSFMIGLYIRPAKSCKARPDHCRYGQNSKKLTGGKNVYKFCFILWPAFVWNEF